MIITENLILRRPEPRDVDAMVAFFMSDRSASVGGPYDLGRAWRIAALYFGHWDIRGFGNFVVTRKDNESALALVGPWHPADWPEREVGWTVLTAKAEGTGLAYEAAQAAVRHAYETLGWDSVVSYIAPANTRSIRLAERLGAVLDVNAAQPRPSDPCLIYRHPRGTE
jgi:RimJ/RimL family protein N-acetyltransferase